MSSSNSRRAEIEGAMAAFTQGGGAVNDVETGKRTLTEKQAKNRMRGDDYTERSMRDAENMAGIHNAYYHRSLSENF